MKASASTRTWTAKFVILSAVAILAVILIGWIVFRVCCPAFIMSSGSMKDTVLPGDSVLVTRLDSFLGRPPHRGQLVAYRWPLDRNSIFLHRIVGVPGDRLKIRNKQLYRNGVKAIEPYVQHSSTYMDSYRDNFPNTPSFPPPAPAMETLDKHVVDGELVVPEGRYFVMGDNRDDAADSRYFGFIQLSDVIGRPFVIYVSRDPKRNGKALH